ncbi:hypothetical protein [Streptomyces sp. WAC06614]|uniref:hypothetical protein n=1 Tax=Streptomyces sp. WAC06614 TaxID=2487416 RepID=UPI0021AF4D9C|nr:hypothetical protein [Streptomyces sp. WAC06614]
MDWPPYRRPLTGTVTDAGAPTPGLPGDPGPYEPYGPDTGPAAPDPTRVDPAVLGALLHRHGWQRRGGPAGRYGRWTPPGRPGTSVLVPETRAFPDCTDLLEEALTALARSGLPSAREVLFGLRVPSDEVGFTRATPETPQGRPYGPPGPAAWTAQEQLRSAARKLLLAGALADVARVGYHGARHRGPAERALAGVLVGPAADGGRLTAHVPVDGGRGTVIRLHHALHAAREAVDYQRATGGMDAFDAAVEAGVSRELAEALVALVRGAEGARVALAWAPAAGVPAGCAARPEPVEFSPGDLPVLREAADRYTRAEPAVPVRVTGTVVRMRRSAVGGGGTVRLRVLTGAEVPYVRAALDEESYRVAGHAHLVGLPVAVSGRLQRRGGFRRLAAASDVTPVVLDDGERDRLMKTLRDGYEG